MVLIFTPHALLRSSRPFPTHSLLKPQTLDPGQRGLGFRVKLDARLGDLSSGDGGPIPLRFVGLGFRVYLVIQGYTDIQGLGIEYCGII